LALELSSVFVKYFNRRQTDALILLLKRYGVHNKLQAAASLFYVVVQDTDKPFPGISFEALVDQYLSISFNRPKQKPRIKLQENDVNIFLDALVFLMIDAMKHFHIPKESFHSTLKKATDAYASEINEHCWKYYKLLSLAMQKITSMDIADLAEAGKPQNHEVFTLDWVPWADDVQNKINEVTFANDMVALFKKTESISAILALFDPRLAQLPIRIPRRHLEAFLVWFDLLHKCGRIKCSTSRGLFKFLKSRMIALGAKRLPERADYRKIKSEALADPNTNQYIRKMLKDPFEKYCPGLKFQVIYSNYFFRML
jgi:hypothetical protein